MTPNALCGSCVAVVPSRAARDHNCDAPRRRAPPSTASQKAPVTPSHASRRATSSRSCVRTAAVAPEMLEAAATASSPESIDSARFAATSMADALSDTGIPEWQIYYGFLAGLSPFVIAAYEFGKRIVIQRQCELCKGSGLIQKGRYMRKCTSCGGFLPWQSWGQFLTSEAGNGGVVRVPKGQTSVFYNVDAALQDSKRQAAERAAEMAAKGLEETQNADGASSDPSR